MSSSARVSLQVPPQVEKVLTEFVEAARQAFGAELRSVVLYGSAAEGKLRATSDVNVLLVLRSFAATQADALRDSLRLAHAAIQLRAMFLLESEIAQAASAFAQKFDDIGHRRQVLFGDDPFAGLQVPRAALRERLLQTTLNLALRLRAAYVTRGSREEQLALAVAETVGPLRTAAASLLELEGTRADSPKEALAQFGQSVGEPADTLARLSQIRETRRAEPGVAVAVLFRLIEMAQKMHARAEKVA